MPSEGLELDRDLEDLLERVRERLGMETREQAAELLLRRRLRKGTRALTGRGRALHLVGRKPSDQT